MSKMIWNAWRSPFFIFYSIPHLQWTIYSQLAIEKWLRVLRWFFFSLPRLFETTFWFCDHKIRFECNRPKCTHSNWRLSITVPYFFSDLSKEWSVTWRVSTIWFLSTNPRGKKTKQMLKMIETNSNKRNVFVRSVRLRQVLIKTVAL